MKEKINNIIFETLKGINEELNLTELESADENTKLLAILDSLSLVLFVTDIEKKIEDEFSKKIVLENKAEVENSKIFENVLSLNLYIQQLLNNS